jgi:hypothetical protein
VAISRDTFKSELFVRVSGIEAEDFIEVVVVEHDRKRQPGRGEEFFGLFERSNRLDGSTDNDLEVESLG